MPPKTTVVAAPPSAAGRRQILRDWALLLPLSLALVWLLGRAGFPAAALLGPVVVATGMALRGATLRIAPPAHAFAQGVAGCLVAHSVTPEILASVLAIWPTVIAFAAVTLALALLVGWTVGRLMRGSGVLGAEEAVWGFLPGMAGAVIAMSHEYRLDSRMVALIQILRLMAVILVMSAASRLLVDPAAVAPRPAEAAGPAGVALTLAVVVLGPLAARWLRVLPAGPMLLPLLVAAGIHASGLTVLPLPGWLLLAAYFVLGAQVGLRFTPALIRHAVRAIGPVILASLVLMLLCALSGAVLALLTGASLLTGILATVPGSVETVAIIAINSGADVPFVMAMQVVRLFAVVLAGPPLARWLCGLGPGVRTPGE